MLKIVKHGSTVIFGENICPSSLTLLSPPGYRWPIMRHKPVTSFVLVLIVSRIRVSLKGARKAVDAELKGSVQKLPL